MDVIKIFITLRDFVTSCLWQLTLKDYLQACLVWFTTADSWTRLNTWWLLIILQTDMFKDLQMTGLLTLQEQSHLPTLMVWYDG